MGAVLPSAVNLARWAIESELGGTRVGGVTLERADVSKSWRSSWQSRWVGGPIESSSGPVLSAYKMRLSLAQAKLPVVRS